MPSWLKSPADDVCSGCRYRRMPLVWKVPLPLPSRIAIATTHGRGHVEVFRRR